MKIKKPLNFGAWVFFITRPSGEEFRIPSSGFFNGKPQLISNVHGAFTNFARQGEPEYLQSAETEAAALKISVTEYISQLVEHQICIRNGGTKGGLCYSSGLGDRLHSIAATIDDIAESTPLRSAYRTLVTATLKSQSMSGCSRCGGTRSYRSGVSNMGRAGKLNNL